MMRRRSFNYCVMSRYLFFIFITIKDGTFKMHHTAHIQNIETVSIEKGVDIITSKHEKSGFERSKESFKMPQEYFEYSKEKLSSSIEDEDEPGLFLYKVLRNLLFLRVCLCVKIKSINAIQLILYCFQNQEVYVKSVELFVILRKNIGVPQKHNLEVWPLLSVNQISLQMINQDLEIVRHV